MFHKIIATLFFVGLSLSGLIGCSLEGDNVSTPLNPNQIVTIKSKITQFYSNFSVAVAGFNHDAMLADFDNRNPDTTKVLAIGEGSWTPYEKDYQTLDQELGEIVADQVKWHSEHHYNLTLNLFDATYQIDSLTHGFAEQRFEVQESGDGYSGVLTTDTGKIIWEVQSISGGWKIIKMTINYDSSPQVAEFALKAKTQTSAFGFGRYAWNN